MFTMSKFEEIKYASRGKEEIYSNSAEEQKEKIDVDDLTLSSALSLSDFSYVF